MAPPAAGDTPPPPPPAADSSASTEESRWLASLSEPELIRDAARLPALNFSLLRHVLMVLQDLLIDLRTLRALGVLLLEDFKQRLREETSLDATVLDRLALSRDCVADASSSSGSDSEVFRRHNKDQPIKPSGVKRKRKQMQDGDCKVTRKEN